MNRQRCVMGMIGLILTGLVVGCSTSGPAPEGTSGAVEGRGVPRAQRPPAAPQPMQEPTWPQNFEVQGPESASFGFAVTQPGPVVVDVQVQGAPVIVTLQGPAPQPDSPPSSGPVRRTYNVTPQDVQKSLFWAVQIRLAQPMPPGQGGPGGRECDGPTSAGECGPSAGSRGCAATGRPTASRPTTSTGAAGRGAGRSPNGGGLSATEGPVRTAAATTACRADGRRAAAY